MRRRAMSVLIVVPTVLLSACGGGSAGSEGNEPVASSAAPSTVASTTPTPTATSTPTEVPRPATTAQAAQLAESVLGTSVARTADEKAVVEAWMTYYDAVSKTYSELSPAPGLDSATGEPLKKVLTYLNTLKTKEHRSVGWSRDNILAVEVRGSSAALRDCAENFTFEVDSSGKPVEDVTPYYLIIGRLEKDGGRWVVTSTSSDGSDEDCRS